MELWNVLGTMCIWSVTLRYVTSAVSVWFITLFLPGCIVITHVCSLVGSFVRDGVCEK